METVLSLIDLSQAPDAIDVAIVGAGPAGLAVGFDLADRGVGTLILEAGDGDDGSALAEAMRAEIADPDRHAPLDIATRPGVGGASRIWGGRILPLDPADFTPRAGAGPNWPMAHADLLPWWRKAAEFLGGELIESPAPGGFARLSAHEAARSETWAAELDMGRRWRARIAGAGGPPILPGARALALLVEGGRIAGLRYRAGGETRDLRAAHVVLACGGLGSLRLLLELDRRMPGAMTGAAHLGNGYMGHLTGAIADLIPVDPSSIAAFGCLPLPGGGAARRRIQPQAAALAGPEARNIAFWLDNPPIGDPAHGSASASAKYLLLRQATIGRRLLSPGLRGAALRGEEPALRPHFANVARAPLSAAIGLAAAAAKRFGKAPLRPETLISSGGGGWRLHYHAEQGPDPANRVTLSNARDADGVPRLYVDYRIGEADVAAAVAAHDALDADLRAAGAGRLRFLHPPGRRGAAVLAAARDGYHQLGGAAMAHSPAAGMTDGNGAVFGVGGLHVASGALFPRGGQANPTLTIVALARRLADRLARREGDGANG